MISLLKNTTIFSRRLFNIFFIGIVGTIALASILLENHRVEYEAIAIPLGNTSTALKGMVNDFPNNDSMKNFEHQKHALLKEMESKVISAQTIFAFRACLGRTKEVSKSDIDLLLNIGSCYHEADISEILQLKVKPASRLNHVILLVTYSIAQAASLAALYSSISQKAKESETEDMSRNIKECQNISDIIFKRIAGLQEQIQNVTKKFNSQLFSITKGLQSNARVFAKDFSKFGNYHNEGQDNNQKHLKFSSQSVKASTNFKPSKNNNQKLILNAGGRVFDLTTEEGRDEWKNYCKNSIDHSASNAMSTGISQNSAFSIDSSTNIIVGDPNDENHHQDHHQADLQEHGGANVTTHLKAQNTINTMDSLKLVQNEAKNIFQTTDKNGKPYKRVFVPGVGWRSAKKIEQSFK